jgi:hypothetical protein
MALSFSVIGDARDLHAIVRDDIYRIGFEAIRNDCVHLADSRILRGAVGASRDTMWR